MYLIGIDEVGRGPIAGPVAVGACVLLVPRIALSFKNFKDSKKLSERQREEWFKRIYDAEKKGLLKTKVTFVSEKIIDSKGLSYAIRSALSTSLTKLKVSPQKSHVLLDGGLKAPAQYLHQTTIIKGDEKELAIALASIVAKVLRDRKMTQLAKKYPGYGFEVHKGYGTKNHYTALRNKGVSVVHRRSFLANFLAQN
ncbi:MAG: ribonuclease HII [Candidatus Taylorbacteria bacterium]|nr:ribonuclease HII [Candidatus Taylorbacteria bacterium]